MVSIHDQRPLRETLIGDNWCFEFFPMVLSDTIAYAKSDRQGQTDFTKG